MPATWAEVSRQLGYAGIGPHSAKHAIAAGAFYMARLRATWRAERPQEERQKLAQASYNAGTGNILKAQRRCYDRRLWRDIEPCLSGITGKLNAKETATYVERIGRWWQMMEIAR